MKIELPYFYESSAAFTAKVNFNRTIEALSKGEKVQSSSFKAEFANSIANMGQKKKVYVRFIKNEAGFDKVALTAEEDEISLPLDVKIVEKKILSTPGVQEKILELVHDFTIKHDGLVEKWFDYELSKIEEELGKNVRDQEVVKKAAVEKCQKLKFEEFWKKFVELPETAESKTKKNFILVKVDQYAVNMQLIIDPVNKQTKGCKFFLIDMFSGKICINSDSEISSKKEKILEATDHTVMNLLNGFDINVTEDTKKLAFERATEFLQNCKGTVYAPSSESVEDVLRDLQKTAVMNAKEEIVNGVKASLRKYEFNPEESTIAIRASHFQKLLDEVGSGYSPIVFCKKVRMLEAVIEKEIIITNRKGYGYGFNTTGNIRYYKFHIMDDAEVQ